MKPEVTIDFAFSYAKLKQLSDNMLLLIDRDIAEFTDRGFNAAKRTAFQTEITAFVAIKSDEEMGGVKRSTTEDKDNARKALEIKMRGIINMAQIVFKDSPGKQAEFGNFDLTRQTDEELVRNAKIMKDTATKYLTNLTGEGLTAVKITALDTLKTTFDTAIDLQKKAINDRNLTTESRRVEANKLYSLLMEYSNKGKSIFSDVSEAKYNDYVIYNTPSGEDESKDDNPV